MSGLTKVGPNILKFLAVLNLYDLVFFAKLKKNTKYLFRIQVTIKLDLTEIVFQFIWIAGLVHATENEYEDDLGEIESDGERGHANKKPSKKKPKKEWG